MLNINIKKCDNKACPLRYDCLRYILPNNTFRQAYGDYDYQLDDNLQPYCENQLTETNTQDNGNSTNDDNYQGYV